jgi:hypothetical protein
MILFTNPGEIDPRLITTLGVNVKDGDSPIGFFGTGLKYAIAVLLREAQQITIFSGLRKFSFEVKEEEVRGKSFGFIFMKEGEEVPLPLGFTTELGKNWSLSNAYRELFSNAKDERGETIFSTSLHQTERGKTIIAVEGEAFEEVHESRSDFLLEKSERPIFSSSSIEVFSGASNAIFYRGIAVSFPSRPTTLTYNILIKIDLTEDRTAKYNWHLQHYIRDVLTVGGIPSDLLVYVLLDDNFEGSCSLHEYSWNENFAEAVAICAKKFPEDLDENIKKKYYALKGQLSKSYKRLMPTGSENERLAHAQAVLQKAGFDIKKYPIFLAEDLGHGILGMAVREEKRIYLSRLAFEQEGLCETLLEEFIHLEHDCSDETRKMQDVLLREIVRLAGGHKAVFVKEPA